MDEPRIPNPAQKTAAAPDFNATPKRTSFAPGFIAFHRSILLLQRARNCACPSATPVLSRYSPKAPRTASDSFRAGLFRLYARILNYFAPVLFLAAKIAIEFFRRARNHNQPLIHAQLLEGLGLDRPRCRFVESPDNLLRCLRRREQAVPAFRRVAGNTGLRQSRQIGKGRRTLRRGHRERAQ